MITQQGDQCTRCGGTRLPAACYHQYFLCFSSALGMHDLALRLKHRSMHPIFLTMNTQCTQQCVLMAAAF